MYKPDEIEMKEVTAITIRDMQIGVSYNVYPYKGASEEATIYRADKPHEDFREAFRPIADIAKEWLEMDLINAAGEDLHMSIVKIKYVQSEKCGSGVKITCSVSGLKYSDGSIKLETPTYYRGGRGEGTDQHGVKYNKQQLTNNQYSIFKKLANEAFKYAYYGKREQPTVTEAAQAAENGGFADEEGK